MITKRELEKLHYTIGLAQPTCASTKQKRKKKSNIHFSRYAFTDLGEKVRFLDRQCESSTRAQIPMMAGAVVNALSCAEPNSWLIDSLCLLTAELHVWWMEES